MGKLNQGTEVTRQDGNAFLTHCGKASQWMEAQADVHSK